MAISKNQFQKSMAMAISISKININNNVKKPIAKLN